MLYLGIIEQRTNEILQMYAIHMVRLRETLADIRRPGWSENDLLASEAPSFARHARDKDH